MARYDIHLIGNELDLTGGDFNIKPSDEQHIQDAINAFPSWWKEFPDDGVGVFAYLNGSTDTQRLSSKIRIQLESDGYSVVNPSVKFDANGKLLINPNATIQ